MPSIGKAIHDIAEADLVALLGQTEDDQIEFKGCVPHEQQADEWAQTRDLSKYGVNKLLRSIVAFANSYGGDLVIGIDEGSGEVGKAEKLTPVPDCMALAQRLSQRAHDLIDPPIPSLQAQGIPLSEDGAGIVVLRVGRSRLAPHRHEGLKECFQRVRHEIRKMSMRQVQDLTFSVNRGLDLVEKRFAELQRRFVTWAAIEQAPQGIKRACVRVSCVPLNGECSLDKVHGVQEIAPMSESPIVKLTPQGQKTALHFPFDPYQSGTILRGTERTVPPSAGNRDNTGRIALFCDGAITYEFRLDIKEPENEGPNIERNSYLLCYEWVLAMVINALESARRFRSYAGASAVEYALELEILAGRPLPVLSAGHSGWNRTFLNAIPQGSTVFPRYAFAGVETSEQLVPLIWRDLWNFIGVDEGGKLQLIRG